MGNRQPTPPPPQQPSPPLPQRVRKVGWPGRGCQRPLYSRSSYSKRVPTMKCKSGEDGTQCLTCRLKGVEYNGNFRYSDYVKRDSKKKGTFRNLRLVLTSDSKYYAYEKAPRLVQILICDYLDRFGCLYLVQPPCDYIRILNMYSAMTMRAKRKMNA